MKNFRNSPLNALVFIMQQTERISFERMTFKRFGTVRNEENYEIATGGCMNMKQDNKIQSLRLMI